MDNLKESIGLTSIFEDPISFEIMENPVISVQCGHSFSEKTIKEWLQKHTKCPICNSDMTFNSLKPNYSLREAISQYKNIQDKFTLKEKGSESNQPKYISDEEEIREMINNAPTKEETIEKWKELNQEPDDIRLLVEVNALTGYKKSVKENLYINVNFRGEIIKASKIIKKSENPIFGENFIFDLKSSKDIWGNLKIELYEEHQIIFKRNNMIGSLEIGLANILEQKKVDNQFPFIDTKGKPLLEGKAKIHLRLSWLNLKWATKDPHEKLKNKNLQNALRNRSLSMNQMEENQQQNQNQNQNHVYNNQNNNQINLNIQNQPVIPFNPLNHMNNQNPIVDPIPINPNNHVFNSDPVEGIINEFHEIGHRKSPRGLSPRVNSSPQVLGNYQPPIINQPPPQNSPVIQQPNNINENNNNNVNDNNNNNVNVVENVHNNNPNVENDVNNANNNNNIINAPPNNVVNVLPPNDVVNVPPPNNEPIYVPPRRKPPVLLDPPQPPQLPVKHVNVNINALKNNAPVKNFVGLDENIELIISMGFERRLARAALELSNNQVENAVQLLLADIGTVERSLERN
eukprot:TRINITY_DN4241_c0_g1_i2.p1 TRINITY_DN4241_c0_g1~~TRINITY_DN4241_c0_g1_i2.p1  ORF type:complete len:573 (-),score=175.07 TRINITY_DN4241_c0_g1_i2:98-1816(-)